DIPKIAWDKVENLSLQSTPQVLSYFEVYTPPVTYPKEVEETLGTPIKVEPFDETQLEDLGLNTYVNLGDKRGTDPPINPYSPGSFRMKVVDSLTIHTPPSPHVASFHPKDVYCYYHSCIDDPKRHYGFRPGLLGHSGSLGVDFLNLEMIEDDWKLEFKEVSFLREGLNLPVRPKEVEKVRIKETHQTNGNLRTRIFEEKKKNSLQTLETASGLILTQSPGLPQENLIFNSVSWIGMSMTSTKTLKIPP
ncbi:hypothetical protein Tco_1307953, partial [Tanacetum coccineum]